MCFDAITIETSLKVYANGVVYDSIIKEFNAITIETSLYKWCISLNIYANGVVYDSTIKD